MVSSFAMFCFKLVRMLVFAGLIFIRVFLDFGKSWTILPQVVLLPTKEFGCVVYLYLATSWRSLQGRLSHLNCPPDVLLYLLLVCGTLLVIHWVCCFICVYRSFDLAEIIHICLWLDCGQNICGIVESDLPSLKKHFGRSAFVVLSFFRYF